MPVGPLVNSNLGKTQNNFGLSGMQAIKPMSSMSVKPAVVAPLVATPVVATPVVATPVAATAVQVVPVVATANLQGATLIQADQSAGQGNAAAAGKKLQSCQIISNCHSSWCHCQARLIHDFVEKGEISLFHCHQWRTFPVILTTSVRHLQNVGLPLRALAYQRHNHGLFATLVSEAQFELIGFGFYVGNAGAEGNSQSASINQANQSADQSKSQASGVSANKAAGTNPNANGAATATATAQHSSEGSKSLSQQSHSTVTGTHKA